MKEFRDDRSLQQTCAFHQPSHYSKVWPAHCPGGQPRQALPFRGPPSYPTNTGTRFHGISLLWSPTPTRCLEKGWFFLLCDYLIRLPSELPSATEQQIGSGWDRDIENTRVPQDSSEMKWLLAAWQYHFSVIFPLSEFYLRLYLVLNIYKKRFPFDDMQSYI